MGLGRITGTTGRTRTSICADAANENAINNAKSITILFV
jgi:hypothetical protein